MIRIKSKITVTSKSAEGWRLYRNNGLSSPFNFGPFYETLKELFEKTSVGDRTAGFTPIYYRIIDELELNEDFELTQLRSFHTSDKEVGFSMNLYPLYRIGLGPLESTHYTCVWEFATDYVHITPLTIAHVLLLTLSSRREGNSLVFYFEKDWNFSDTFTQLSLDAHNLEFADCSSRLGYTARHILKE